MKLKDFSQIYMAVPKDINLEELNFLEFVKGFIFADSETLEFFSFRNKAMLLNIEILNLHNDDVTDTLPFFIPNKDVYFEYVIPLLDKKKISNIFIYDMADLKVNRLEEMTFQHYLSILLSEKDKTILGLEKKLIDQKEKYIELMLDTSSLAFHNTIGEEYDKLRGEYWSKKFAHCGKNLRVSEGCRFIGSHNFIIKDNVYIGPNVTIEVLSQDSSIIIGNETKINGNAILLVKSNDNSSIEIGERCVIGYHSFILDGFGVKIGDDVLMGPKVNINNYNHQYMDSTKLIAHQGGYGKATLVENDVWIGIGSTITGVVLGTGAVIGAGSLVNKNVDKYHVVVGTPAKCIKIRE